jgi:hypothetical protein
MWVFRREVFKQVSPQNGGMPFSEEIKLAVIDTQGLRFGEYHIDYHERIGETKLFAWKDGVENLVYLFERRFRGTPIQRIITRLAQGRLKTS